MNYAVVLSSIFAVHALAMISPGPNVLIITQTALGHTRRAQQVYRGIKRWVDRIAGAALAFLGLRLMLPSR